MEMLPHQAAYIQDTGVTTQNLGDNKGAVPCGLFESMMLFAGNHCVILNYLLSEFCDKALQPIIFNLHILVCMFFSVMDGCCYACYCIHL
jgi:hypothetical protein